VAITSLGQSVELSQDKRVAQRWGLGLCLYKRAAQGWGTRSCLHKRVMQRCGIDVMPIQEGNAIHIQEGYACTRGLCLYKRIMPVQED
jgi:hypothetical protein